MKLEIGEVIYLINVSPKKNSNKFYIIERISTNQIVARYGRINEGSAGSKTYQYGRLESLYKSKIRKGYVDKTNLYEQTRDGIVKPKQKVVNKYSDPVTQKFFEYLLNESRNAVNSVITTDVSDLTLLHVEASKKKLLLIVDAISTDDIKRANELLVEQFEIIPRFISRVGGVSKLLFSNDKEKNAKILEKEYQLLESIEALVKQSSNKNQNEAQSVEYSYTLSKVVGDKFDELVEKYKRGLIRDYKDTYIANIFSVDVKRQLSDVGNNQLHWHGSKTQNWNSILDNGLKIRPKGIPTTGAMFGNGIYFAPLSQKSVGYTSLRGSYWAKGDKKRGIIALYKLALGKVKENKTGGSADVQKIGDANSLWCFGKEHNNNSRLYNDEIIIPNSNQAVCQYILDIRKD